MLLQSAGNDSDKPSTSTDLPTDSNIMNTLLVHESKSAVPQPVMASAALGGAASDKSDDSDMEDVTTGIGKRLQDIWLFVGITLYSFIGLKTTSKH